MRTRRKGRRGMRKRRKSKKKGEKRINKKFMQILLTGLVCQWA